ncbi:hypothetical protein ACEN9H_23480 [Massilia cellulosiltytica]|uniref:hypothetical protein n=1 Tax=Massilia cellulosiltytica TaxID=2683234 RepID=UPI0039B40355
MKLSKEQQQSAVDKLSTPWGRATLRCDGYLVTLDVRRISKASMSYRVFVYVNGTMNSAWCYEKNAAPEAKFLRKSVRPNVSPVKRKEVEKALGKRRMAKDPYWSGSMTLYLPDFANGKAAISHLCKVCESVELLDDDAAREALAAIAAPAGAAEADATAGAALEA